MKIVYFLLLNILFTHPLLAQNKYATTTDGKRVILKPDGTWSYVQYDVSTARDQSSAINGTATDKRGTTAVKKNSSAVRSSRQYIRGPRGGCYYINSNGNKTYVDRSLCN